MINGFGFLLIIGFYPRLLYRGICIIDYVLNPTAGFGGGRVKRAKFQQITSKCSRSTAVAHDVRRCLDVLRGLVCGLLAKPTLPGTVSRGVGFWVAYRTLRQLPRYRTRPEQMAADRRQFRQIQRGDRGMLASTRMQHPESK